MAYKEPEMHCSWVNLFVAIVDEFWPHSMTHIVCDMLEEQFGVRFQYNQNKQKSSLSG